MENTFITKYIVNWVGEIWVSTSDKTFDKKAYNFLLVDTFSSNDEAIANIKKNYSPFSLEFDNLEDAVAKAKIITLTNNAIKQAPLNSFGMTILNTILSFYGFNKDDDITDKEVMDAYINLLDCQNKVDYLEKWEIKPETKATFQKIVSKIAPEYLTTIMERIEIYSIVAPDAPFVKMCETEVK